MPRFRVFVFITNAFCPEPLTIGRIRLVPFHGVGTIDISELIADFARSRSIPPAPKDLWEQDSKRAEQKGSTVVIEFDDIAADTPQEAIQQTERDVVSLLAVLTIRQIQRGTISAFLSVRTDVAPNAMHVYIRGQQALGRKVINLSYAPGGEAQEIMLLMEEARISPRFALYLSLFGEAISPTGTLASGSFRDLQIVKLWTLLETMATNEPKTNKRQKVRSLFRRHRLSTYPDFRGHAGRDLIDIAYEWRNVVAHAGGCGAASAEQDRRICERYSKDFDSVREELIQAVRFLIRRIALANQDQRSSNP